MSGFMTNCCMDGLDELIKALNPKPAERAALVAYLLKL
jgi:hypothetical protein